MKIFLILLILLTGTAYAADKYDAKDFTGRLMTDKTDLNGKTIEGACFSQEKPDTHIFPENMTGVTFKNCNLDNVFIPEGNTLIACSNRRFKAQTDGEDWLVGVDGKPISPLNPEDHVARGKDPNPAKLPKVN